MNSQCQTCSFRQKISDFLWSPVTSHASTGNWFLFLGLVLVVAYLWHRVVKVMEGSYNAVA